MKVLVCGATGYLGQELTNHYRSQGHDVVTLGRSPKNDINLDITNFNITKLINVLVKIDLVVHCAAINEVEIAKDIVNTYNVNVVLTRLLIEMAVKLSVSSFIYVSTFHVYGTSCGEITEKNKMHPINDYGLTHYLSEEIVRVSCGRNGIDFLILRPTNIYGRPSDISSFNRKSLVPFQFLEQALMTNEIVINSSGQQYRNFVSVKEVVDCLKFVGSEEIINCYGELNTSIEDFAHRIGGIVNEEFDKNVKVRVCGKRVPGNYALSVSNTNSLYQPRRECLKEFVVDMVGCKKQWTK
ncbi:NAD(P)-dependent oxidoreductase [Alginatibacterium sediminis]|uniref:NAD(P)-dependent oxidoreductase n=1 Tax=Alginatibacterium sediminis TaxID=2164068 RepID=A0A420EAW8_9ALTE|nr:NAD(P)-dependent oxidoreductase [Alginatibacterium sediminis]RKF17820.1 NAD(P)-dependent oxidoreductase [Alginatibacterium sediminis]